MTPTLGTIETIVIAVGLTILAAGWWRRWLTRWTRKLRLSGAHGTVYVTQDRAEPELIKVGVTTRLSRERKAEIVRTMAGGAPQRLLLAMDLAHARSVETVAHRRLQCDRHHCNRGREWYEAATPATLAQILAEVEHAAHNVRRLAQRQGAWIRDDDEGAYRWRLTPNGPIRTRLFQPRTAPAYGRSATRAMPMPR